MKMEHEIKIDRSEISVSTWICQLSLKERKAEIIVEIIVRIGTE